jgi:cyclophilin family peptidyl-prolyl cis-trans isomerase
MDGDPQWSVRAALARVLGEIGGARAIALLQQMASERDFRVRPHALRALVQASPSQAFPILIDHLKAEDPFERAAAAEGLRTLRQDGGVTPLRAAMEASLRDTAPDPGLGILAALEAYGDEAVRPAAQIALDHDSWPVRKRAAGILRRLGDPVAPVAGPTTDRTVSDLLSLLTATYTPHAFIRTTKGNIEIELFIVDAPGTVGNFMKLARDGFYNGLSIDRVVPNFLIQGGDPRGDTHGGPGYYIRGEMNRRPFLRGSLGMALAVDGSKDTGGSQFFICHLPQPQLGDVHTAFGQVVTGIDVVDRLVPGDVIQEVMIWDGITDPNQPTTSGSPSGADPGRRLR